MKKETLEYGLLQHIKTCLECNNESQAIRLIEKYGFEKQERMYSVIDEYVNDVMGGCNLRFEEWFEQFKK